MLLLAKKMLSEYRALVLKMHQDFTTISQVAHNLQLLCDLESMLGLFCLMPMLDVATLTLGSRPRQGGCKVAGQEGDSGITTNKALFAAL
jgi:hypothetical protein